MTRSIACLAVALLVACSDRVASGTTPDGSTPDAGTLTDAGGGGSDAGQPLSDGGGTGFCPAPASSGADGGPPACGTAGLTGPLPTCSPELPCSVRILDGGLVTVVVTTDLNPETVGDGGHQCPLPDAGGVGGDTVIYWSAPGLASGEQRWACLYTPPSAGTQKKPLVVFFPGSQADADSIYTATSLHDKAQTYDVSTGADGTGFILATIQSRNLHDFDGSDGDGQHEDGFFRDLASPSCNPDIASADALIDLLGSSGTVDEARIFVMGWSNGAHFAQLYAIARHGMPTPGQRLVAATMVYAGADPFSGVPSWGSDATCQNTTYPTSDVPLYQVHRSCDALVACDTAQDVFGHGKSEASVETWLTVTLPQVVGDGVVVDQMIDGTNASVSACEAVPPCTAVVGLVNHLNWPAGRGGRMDWEPAMLDFGAQHHR